jgi:hypothetical protein
MPMIDVKGLAGQQQKRASHHRRSAGNGYPASLVHRQQRRIHDDLECGWGSLTSPRRRWAT